VVARWACGYCGLVQNSEGGTQFKQHLAAIGVNVNGCMNVPNRVVAVFRTNLPTEKGSEEAGQRRKSSSS
jgi:hypothetical protein